VPLETRNIREQELFLSGKKNIAVISEVASSGISFHVCNVNVNLMFCVVNLT
jgi:hypothetical protein